MNGIDDYDNYVVKKGIIRYKFIIVLFLLSLCIFHPETFDFVRKYGIVVETKTAEGFLAEEGVDDIKVMWEDNETFWCLDFTLRHVY